MSVTATIDTADLNRTLKDLAIAAGKDADTIVIQESKLFAEQAMRRTPPRTQAQGRRAVARDIKKIMAAAPESLIRHAIGQNEGSAENIKVFTGDTEEPSIEWRRAQLSAVGLKDYHRAQRDRRGRIQRKFSGGNTGAGRWVENKRLVVPEKARARFIRDTQKNVGRLKAGWLPSVRKYHGRAPKWVAKHAAGARGSAQLLGRGTHNVTSIMTNTAAGAGDLNRFLRDVLRIRLSAMKRKLRLINSGYARDVSRNMRVRSRARRNT